MSALSAAVERARLAGEQAAVLEGALRRERFDVDAAVDAALGGPVVDRLEAARSVPLDPQRARNLPIIGPASPGGHIPGSRPDRNRRLDSWSGRG